MIRTLDADLLEAWDALALATGAPVFARPGWLRAWATAFGRLDDLRALTVHRGGELVAVLPVVGGRAAVRTPVNSETAMIVPVVADGDAAAELAQLLLARRAGVVDLDAVLADDPLTTQVRRTRNPVHATVRCRSPYVDTSGEVDAYLATLSKSRRKEVRRRERRLEEMGELTFEMDHGTGDDLGARLEEGFRLEAREWKLAAGSAIVSSPARVAFYTAGARWAAEQGVLRLAALRVDGHAFASGYCLEQSGTLHFLKLGMDDAYAKYGPGLMINLRMIEHAFARSDLDTFDMLGEFEPYKADLTGTVREQHRLRVYPTPVVGGVQRAATAAAGDLRRAVVARLSAPTRERLLAIKNRLQR
ncbi:GNAT family N-acetyltransferase [Actinomycetospora aeridis]|uniref:GNAT family N-acetyltransferase n=1 Tax=Actinomycetospora aeridis TaxID=3129231 RepID=A0ABU8N0H8_9PSEU